MEMHWEQRNTFELLDKSSLEEFHKTEMYKHPI